MHYLYPRFRTSAFAEDRLLGQQVPSVEVLDALKTEEQTPESQERLKNAFEEMEGKSTEERNARPAGTILRRGISATKEFVAGLFGSDNHTSA